MSKPHKCGVPGCHIQANRTHWACWQHRVIMGWRWAARMQTAYRERTWSPAALQEFESARKECLEHLESIKLGDPTRAG